MMLICHAKNEVKRYGHSGVILRKIINVIGRNNFWAKTQEQDC